MFFERISVEVLLFLILYGVTGVVPFIAAVYLLLRRGKAFADDVTPPLCLRRWAASFFGVSVLGHVWWVLLYVFSDESLSLGYVLAFVLDSVTLLPTIAGTQLSMLQDRRRRVWPVLVGLLPFLALGAVLMARPTVQLLHIAIAYLLLLYVLFTLYVAFAVRQYRRWLRDNYADLARKEVWQTQVLFFLFMLLFFVYALANCLAVIFFLHFIELLLFAVLLWRVETLPALTPCSPTDGEESAAEVFSPVKQLLAVHCVGTQLYLQHDLSLQQLAKAVGTNRTYLGQYFLAQGTTYNAYINDLRIAHFVSRYRETFVSGQPVTAQQLACESGYRSYSTFSIAFKQRMGMSVKEWMHWMENGEAT